MQKVNISLLVFNEGQTIRETIVEGYKDLEDLGINFELWVIDNASEDNTKEIVMELQEKFPKLNYYLQSENIGYALSSESSFKVPDADVYITVDGDGQYRLTDIKLLLDIVNNGTDAVFAVRKIRKDPMGRIVMSSVFNLISKILLPIKVQDLNCGFRALSKKAAQKIFIQNKVNYVGPEIYVRLLQLNMKIQDVDVRHFERKAGNSVYTGLMSTMKSCWGMLTYLYSLKSEYKAMSAPTNGLAAQNGKVYKPRASKPILTSPIIQEKFEAQYSTSGDKALL